MTVSMNAIKFDKSQLSENNLGDFMIILQLQNKDHLVEFPFDFQIKDYEETVGSFLTTDKTNN